MIPNNDVTPGVNKKRLPKFKGPYLIKRIVPHDHYVITDPKGFQITQKPFESVFEGSSLKKWSKP